MADDAQSPWPNDSQGQPAAIGIPAQDILMNNGNGAAEDGWGAQTGEEHRPREGGRSRSRSPGRGRDTGGRPEVGTNPGNNLHVSGLGHRIDNRDLEAAFGKFGRVQKAAVMYDPHTRESRGFGFVTMETSEEADAAIAGLNATEINGKTINIEKARRGRARTPTPGRYFGPPKRGDNERPYDPRPYDSRYRGYEDDRRGGRGSRYDDRGGGRDYDRDRYSSRDYDRGGYGGRDYDRGGYGGRYDSDRRYDDRRY